MEAVEALLEVAAKSLEQRPEFLRLLLLIALERAEVDERSFAASARSPTSVCVG